MDLKEQLLSLSICLALCLTGVVRAAQRSTDEATARDYVVGPQDVLTITSYDQPDLSNKFTVEMDGTFTYPLIGRFRAGGLTLRPVPSGRADTSAGRRGAQKTVDRRRLFRQTTDHRFYGHLQEPAHFRSRRSQSPGGVSTIGGHDAHRGARARVYTPDCGSRGRHRSWRRVRPNPSNFRRRKHSARGPS